MARWRYGEPAADWAKAYAGIRAVILDAFANTHSRALQQTLQAMGTAVLRAHPEAAEIRFAAPNKHQLRRGPRAVRLDNPGEVFYAADRPYGLIEATVIREDAPEPGLAWSAGLHPSGGAGGWNSCSRGRWPRRSRPRTGTPTRCRSPAARTSWWT